MNNLDSMLKRNKDFAAYKSTADTYALASAGAAECKAIIIGCGELTFNKSYSAVAASRETEAGQFAAILGVTV